MNKNKDLMLELLMSKNNLTYKEIANKTGYHEKSLIRIKKQLDDNHYQRRNLTDNEKKYITNLYTKSNMKSIKKFYNYYLTNNKEYPNRSYSRIQKLLKSIKDNNISNTIIVGNITDNNTFARYYYAYNIDNKEIIYLEKGFKEVYKIYFKIIKYILNNYKDKDIIFKGNSFLKNKKGYKYKIFIDYLNKNKIKYKIENIYLSKKIIEKIKNNPNINSNDKNIIKELYLEKIIIAEEERKTIEDNIIEYQNIRYKIITNKTIAKGNNVTIINYLYNKTPHLKYKNKVYELTNIYSKESKKKYN